MAYTDASPIPTPTEAAALAALAARTPGTLVKIGTDGKPVDGPAASVLDYALRPVISEITIGAGGATSQALAFSAAEYTELKILCKGLFARQSKATLTADGAAGTQTIWRDDGTGTGTIKGAFSSSVFLSRFLGSVLGSTVLNSSGTWDVVSQGNYLYVTNRSGHTFQIVDATNPFALSATATLDIGASSLPSGLAVRGDYAYVTLAGTASALIVISIANKASPSVVGTCSTGTSAGSFHVVLSGDYAYVANNTAGTVTAVSVATPASPSVVGSPLAVDAGTNCLGVSGNYLYTSNYTGGTLQAIDITNPAAMALVVQGAGPGTTLAIGVHPGRLFISGNRLYVVNVATQPQFLTVDISNPAALAILGSVQLYSSVGGAPSGLAVLNNYAYVPMNGLSYVQVVDISSDATPSLVTTITTGANPQFPFLLNEMLSVVIGGTHSVSIFDVSSTLDAIVTLTRTGSNRWDYSIESWSSSGRHDAKIKGVIPSWSTGLTITSSTTNGLIEGGTITVLGDNPS